MEVEIEESIIQSCLRQIETQLGWGNGDEWSTQDFEALSKKILESTGVALSVATLKRIWGKVRYDSKPTITTLNALAQFIGYENWRAYKQSHHLKKKINGQAKENGAAPEINSSKKISWFWITAISLIIVALCLFLVVISLPDSGSLDPEHYSFSSKKVIDEGVPNTVIFDYNARAAGDDDSVYIQQSWDKRLSTLVEKDRHQHTSIYYYPGFFAAKLRVNDSIMKEHNLIIKTKGWLPLIEQKPVPVYFEESDAMQESTLKLSVEQIVANNVPLQPSPPRIAYYNVGDFGDVTTHDLVMETQIKNDYADGANACQHTEISILFNGGAMVLPLAAKGCVSELNFMNMEGKKSDLSVLGCDFSDWVNVKIEFLPEKLKVVVQGDSLVFKIKTMPIKMVGVAYKFQGTGSVNEIKVTNHNGDILFYNQF